MYLRFVWNEFDSDAEVREGIFGAAFALRRSGEMWEDEYHELTSILRWFDEHLEGPSRFCRSTRPGRQPKAVCWFKSSATRHIRKIWEMVAILENNELQIHMIKAARPGYVVYEDDFQIAAEPFADLKRQEMR